MNIRESNLKIVELLAKGGKVKEIATELGMAERTVYKKVSQMKEKYNCSSTAQLIYKLIMKDPGHFAQKE